MIAWEYLSESRLKEIEAAFSFSDDAVARVYVARLVADIRHYRDALLIERIAVELISEELRT